MNRLFIGLILLSFLAIPFASAEWFCGDGSYDECPSQYPVECCVNKIATCLYSDQSCNQNCCIGGGCNSWDDYWFCKNGQVANCNVETTYPKGMVCCESNYPKWNNKAQECWKNEWQCTQNSHCDSDKCCFSNKCELVNCEGGNCKEWELVNTKIVDHKCTVTCVLKPGYCNSNSDCYATQSCSDIHKCTDLVCNDGNDCTIDTPVNHECKHEQIFTGSCNPCSSADTDDGKFCTVDTCTIQDGKAVILHESKDGLCLEPIYIIGGLVGLVVLIIIGVVVAKKKKKK